MASPDTELPEQDSERSFWWYARVVTYAVYAYVLAVVTILGLAFVFHLFGADGGSGFVDWVYRSAADAMSPFREVFGGAQQALTGEETDAVLESSFLFAAVSYGIFALVLHDLIEWLSEAVERRSN